MTSEPPVTRYVQVEAKSGVLNMMSLDRPATTSRRPTIALSTTSPMATASLFSQHEAPDRIGFEHESPPVSSRNRAIQIELRRDNPYFPSR